MEGSKMASRDAGRSLVWHGVFLFLLGLLTGLAIPALTSPRLGLSAHMEALLNGMFLVIVGGVVWRYLNLPDRIARAVFWLLLFSAYANWAFCFLAALFGASEILPIAGAGYSAEAWQEQLVKVGLGLGAVSILLAMILVLYGLRGGAAGASQDREA
jgi:hydroxylaminobenzene mutase